MVQMRPVRAHTRSRAQLREARSAAARTLRAGPSAHFDVVRTRHRSAGAVGDVAAADVRAAVDAAAGAARAAERASVVEVATALQPAGRVARAVESAVVGIVGERDARRTACAAEVAGIRT